MQSVVEPRPYFATVQSPKFVVSPNVAIVINSIRFIPVGATYPPPINPRVALDNPAAEDLPALRSPKSCAFPVDAIVTN